MPVQLGLTISGAEQVQLEQDLIELFGKSLPSGVTHANLGTLIGQVKSGSIPPESVQTLQTLEKAKLLGTSGKMLNTHFENNVSAALERTWPSAAKAHSVPEALSDAPVTPTVAAPKPRLDDLLAKLQAFDANHASWAETDKADRFLEIVEMALQIKGKPCTVQEAVMLLDPDGFSARSDPYASLNNAIRARAKEGGNFNDLRIQFNVATIRSQNAILSEVREPYKTHIEEQAAKARLQGGVGSSQTGVVETLDKYASRYEASSQMERADGFLKILEEALRAQGNSQPTVGDAKEFLKANIIGSRGVSRDPLEAALRDTASPLSREGKCFVSLMELEPQATLKVKLSEINREGYATLQKNQFDLERTERARRPGGR